MSSPAIYEFLFDDENEAKINGHGLSTIQVEQILGNGIYVVRNRKRRRAKYMVIGKDDSGACIAVPIEGTTEPEVWRPVTAWPCKPTESVAYERSAT